MKILKDRAKPEMGILAVFMNLPLRHTLIWQSRANRLFLNPSGVLGDSKTTQPNSVEGSEEEPVHLPCNHSTISGPEYVYWYWQIPHQVQSTWFMVWTTMWQIGWPLWTSPKTESPAPWSCPRSPWETPLCTTVSWETHTGTDGAAPVQCVLSGEGKQQQCNLLEPVWKTILLYPWKHTIGISLVNNIVLNTLKTAKIVF